MNKKIIAIIGVALLIAAICTVFVIKHKNGVQNASQNSYDTFEEANNAADFNLEYSDRLCGDIPTGYNANSSTIEVQYGNSGFIRKTLGVNDNSGNSKDYDLTAEQDVDGRKVTFKGKNEKIYLAVWNYNNFAYTIELNENGEGVTQEEMIEYIEATW